MTSALQRATQTTRQLATARARRLSELLELPDEALSQHTRLADNPAIEPLPARRPGGSADAPIAGANDAGDPSLLDELIGQLRLERLPTAVRDAGLALIPHLDERGLLTTTVPELAADLGVDVATVEAARAAVRALDPPGCGAVSLAEHLTWAVEAAWPDDPFFPDLVRHHLDDLRAGRLDRPARALDLDPEDVEEYRQMLATVPPWPTHGRADGGVAPAAPPSFDLYDCPDTGRLRVRADDDAVLRWRISPTFAAATAALPPGDERRAAERQLAEAADLLALLERRGSLTRQIVELAVARQQDLLRHGPAHAAPLRMSDLAQLLDIDASTVSRAANGRWLSTPRGPVPLRALFVWRNHGAEATAAGLRDALARLIAAERPSHPLTDDELAAALTRAGVPVARRTVARHRAALGLPGAPDRRR
jgi:RNA polymerase sigma-54 factor